MNRFRVAAVVLLLAVSCTAVFYVDIKDWFKFRIEYADYLVWKQNGGSFQEKFYEPLRLDRHRDSMFSGIGNPDDIKKKFPFLTEGESYPVNSYKGEYLRNATAIRPDLHLLWFNQEDGFDWCVEIYKEKATLASIKG